ncbi:MAG: hypothetical protein ACJASX_002955 [Limisphaerales bacterium]|jgi:hypothetical protein
MKDETVPMVVDRSGERKRTQEHIHPVGVHASASPGKRSLPPPRSRCTTGTREFQRWRTFANPLEQQSVAWKGHSS